MKKIHLHNFPIVYMAIIYLCGFLLFLEWIYPLQGVAAAGSLTYLMVYAGFCFLISLLQVRWWLSFLLKGFGLLFLMNMLFYSVSLFDVAWLGAFLEELYWNIQILFTQDWYLLSPIFRTFLFLLFIWIASYLIYYWTVLLQRVFLFALLTFIYLGLMDTFTPYNAEGAIVRAFIVTLAAMGIAHFIKEMNHEGIRVQWMKKSLILPVSLLVVIGISLVVGFAGPKHDPQWPDPVPFIQHTAGNLGETLSEASVQKVGYGEDDSRLGGSFVQDDTPVFRVAAPEEEYWRVETKDMYTGKGWENSTLSYFMHQPDGQIDLDTFTPAVDTENRTAHVAFDSRGAINKLVYPYGLQQISGVDSDIYVDDLTEAVSVSEGGGEANVDQYTIQYGAPSFTTEALRGARGEAPQAIQEQYTQLPSTLPDRVGELAEEITAPFDTQYDKALAIEEYLSSSEFTYSTTDVAVPDEEEDYVDQFLFETRIGYCDNFSSAMVVMLRTLDIPTRWVKGFTSGETVADESERFGDSHQVYEVTNANAHSWVEVYFPEAGWVPFEPTKGFSNISDFQTEGETAFDMPEETPQETPEEESEEETSVSRDNETGAQSFPWWPAAIILAVILIFGWLIYRFRFHLLTGIIERWLYRDPSAANFQKAYHYLLKVLAYRGYPRSGSQTLREFARKVDAQFETNEMGLLTAYYEQILYRDAGDETEIPELIPLWKNLINRIMG